MGIELMNDTRLLSSLALCEQYYETRSLNASQDLHARIRHEESRYAMHLLRRQHLIASAPHLLQAVVTLLYRFCDDLVSVGYRLKARQIRGFLNFATQHYTLKVAWRSRSGPISARTVAPT